MIRLTHLIAASSLFLLGSLAWAGNAKIEEAKQHFARAETAYKLGKYSEAIEDYEAAFRAWPEPAFLFNIAQALRQQYTLDKQTKHLKKARPLYKRYLREQPQAANRALVEEMLQQIQQILAEEERQARAEHQQGMLCLTSKESAGAQVLVEGTPAGLLPLEKKLPPGRYRLQVKHPGYHEWSSTVTIAAGSRLEMPITLIPLAPEPASSGAEQQAERPVYKRWWFWAAIVTTVAAGSAVGIYYGTRGDEITPMPQVDLR